MKKGISLSIDGKEVSASMFLKASNRLLLLLNEVEMSMSKEVDSKLNWIIEDLSTGSADISVFDPNNDYCVKVCDAVASGLNLLREKVSRPPFFSNNALRHAKELTAITGKGKATITSRDINAELDSEIILNANMLLSSTDGIGSIEGVIRMVTKAGGLQCNLYDLVTGIPVHCNLNDEQLKGIMSSFVNDRRVSITGIISFTADGYPKSIKEITDIYTFPPDNELPTLDDLIKSDLDITGGLTFEEFMERKRDRGF